MDGADVLSTIGQSQHRLPVLSALRDGAMTNRELRDRLGLPRTTVRNNLLQLCDNDWVRETADRRYELTNLGRLVASRAECFAAEVAGAHQLVPFVERLPPAELEGIEFGLLADAELIEPEPNRPYAPDERLRERALDARTVRTVCGVVTPILFDQLCHRDLDGVDAIELILGTDAYDVFRSRYDAGYRRVRQHENAVVRRCDEAIPYDLTVTDDYTLLQSYDVSATSVLLETRCENARAWAETRLETYRQRAQRLEA